MSNKIVRIVPLLFLSIPAIAGANQDGRWLGKLSCGPNQYDGAPAYSRTNEFILMNGSFFSSYDLKSKRDGIVRFRWNGEIKNGVTILTGVGQGDSQDKRWTFHFKSTTTEQNRIVLNGTHNRGEEKKLRECEFELTQSDSNLTKTVNTEKPATPIPDLSHQKQPSIAAEHWNKTDTTNSAITEESASRNDRPKVERNTVKELKGLAQNLQRKLDGIEPPKILANNETGSIRPNNVATIKPQQAGETVRSDSEALSRSDKITIDRDVGWRYTTDARLEDDKYFTEYCTDVATSFIREPLGREPQNSRQDSLMIEKSPLAKEAFSFCLQRLQIRADKKKKELQEVESKKIAARQAQEEEAANLRSGKIQPKNINQAVVAHSAENGNDIITQPKLRADGKIYAFYGVIEEASKDPEFKARGSRGPGGDLTAKLLGLDAISSNTLDQSTFKVKIPANLQSHYFGTARNNGGFSMVGRYVDNYTYTSLGGRKTIPIFEAIYFEMWNR